MPFLLKFVDWIAKTGEFVVAARVGVSPQAVRSWRRWAGGKPRCNNAYPPSLDNARLIQAVSTLTLDDIYGERP